MRISLAIRYSLAACCMQIACATHAGTHEVRLEIAPDLETVAVRIVFAEPGLELRASGGRGRGQHPIELVADLASCDGAKPNIVNRRIRMAQDSRCLEYTATMDPVPGRRRLGLDAASVRMTAPRRWLWLPRLQSADAVELDVELPEGVDASFPWPQAGDGRYVFGASPRSGLAAAILGDFEKIDLSAEGIRKPVAFVGPAEQRSKIAAWLQAAARGLRGIGGHAPNPQVQIVVIPVSQSRGRSPVPFGHVVRDHGETIMFYVDLEHDLESYLGDWTAPHELAHTLLPYVDSQWISEGFAGYYQNIILARSGEYLEKEVWRRLARSFRRAGEVENPPSPNGTRNRPFWEVRMLLYWSGAAMALMADVELRARGAGSLDEVLGQLAKCCLPSGQTWRGRALFQKLDELGGNGVFLDIYDQHAEAEGMPETAALFERLGVRADGELSDAAELADVRRAIMMAQSQR